MKQKQNKKNTPMDKGHGEHKGHKASGDQPKMSEEMAYEMDMAVKT